MSRVRSLKVRLLVLAALLLAGCAGLLCVHLHWMAAGPRDPRFAAFLRRYAQRAHNKDVIPEHGVALDRNGARLGIAQPGTVFQRALDARALEEDGRPVKLSVDGALQVCAARLMKGRTGAVVALEPATGRLRALVSTPRGDAAKPAYIERALTGLYPPGSTFKVFMAAAALSEGLDPVFDCPASGYRSAPATPAIRDVEARQAERRGRVWKGFGKLAMGPALMHSSNVYFAKLGVKLGPEAFGRVVAASRLRDSVCLLPSADVSLEAAGCGVPEGLRAPELAPVAIGQGRLLLTPLAVAMVTAAVADDGVMLEPTLLDAARPKLRARPFTYEAAARVRKMMRQVVESGTGTGCRIPGLDVCGQTGTAQTGQGREQAGVSCFAPEEAPRLVVTVLVERGGFGAEAALPVARGVLEQARELGYFE